MAGANKILKEGQVLFKAGDQSDGMYLIRKGELRVYLEQEDKEVVLANIPAGAMIGEMALFDKQPRSASVKATTATEVTHITTHDFGKLMRQIPKWFVSLMSSLSGRLRETNERLQRLEQGGPAGGVPFRTAGRMLNVLLLVWHKDGDKQGRDFVLTKKTVEESLINLFGEDPAKVKSFFETLVAQELISTKKDTYNNVVLATSNKGHLAQLSKSMIEWGKSKPKTPCLSDAALSMLKVLKKLAEANPYDSLTVSLTELVKEGKRSGENTSGWEEAVAQLKNSGDAVRLVKTSDGVGFRTTKKEVGSFLLSHQCMSALYKANLS